MGAPFICYACDANFRNGYYRFFLEKHAEKRQLTEKCIKIVNNESKKCLIL